MSPDLSKKLIHAVESMPAFPKSVQSIIELTRDVNCTPKELVQVIDKDPVITVKILKAVNSAYYALPKQITSLSHAVVYLGFNTIKNLALGIAAIGMLPKHNAAEFDIEQYLLHSLSTAFLAKKLALELDIADPMDCFIGGLLHDFGKVVCAQFMPNEFKAALLLAKSDQSSLHLALRGVLGVDHAVIGAMLAEKWRFAPLLVDSIAQQFEPKADTNTLFACVFTANQISKQLGHGNGGNPGIYPLPPAVALTMGGDLNGVILSISELNATFEDAKLFAHI